MFACLVVLVYVGCPATEATADVELDLDVAGARYSARVKKTLYGGLYYNTSPIWAALGKATAVALQQMAHQEPTPTAGR